MKIISVDVVGVPVAQGSLKRTAFGVIYSNDKELKSWRQDVMTYLIAAKPRIGILIVRLVFLVSFALCALNLITELKGH